jgi:hypothetical protein
MSNRKRAGGEKHFRSRDKNTTSGEILPALAAFQHRKMFNV